MGDVTKAMPWSNTVDVVRIPGKALKEALEHSVAEYDIHSDDPTGKFLQISGLSVKFDVRRPVGERVVTATLASSDPIIDQVAYDVAVPSFLVKGGDGYNMIKDNLVEHRNTGFLDNDLLVSYIRKNTPIGVPNAGRIEVLTSESGGGGDGQDVSSANINAGGISIVLSSLVLYLVVVLVLV